MFKRENYRGKSKLTDASVLQKKNTAPSKILLSGSSVALANLQYLL